MACPIVCPKLTRFRRPVISRSSAVTMCDLVAIEWRIRERRRSWEAEGGEEEFDSRLGEVAASVMEDERDSRRANSSADQIAAVYIHYTS